MKVNDIGSRQTVYCVWSSFLQMVQDWRLHLQLTEQMLPSKFAYDHPNYVRFLTYYTVSNILHSCSAEIARNASTDSSAVHFQEWGIFRRGTAWKIQQNSLAAKWRNCTWSAILNLTASEA